MSIVKLALRMLARDWRGGELRVLALALVVAVASVTSVGFFTDRLSRALNEQSAQLLGGDLVVISDRPIAESARAQASRAGLTTAATVRFLSMLLYGERSRLVELKAVEAGYPLRGSLRLRDAASDEERATRRIPAPGTVWLSEPLASALGIRVGAVVQLGEARLRVSELLTFAPDQALDVFNVAPRVVMHSADLPATGLLQVGSRVSYRLLIAGALPAVESLRSQLKLERGQRMESTRDARPEVRKTLERAERFLGLAALTSVVLAAVAVGMAARSFMQRHFDACAMLRCFGASQRTMLQLYGVQIAAICLGAIVLGCLIGAVAQQALAFALRRLAAAELPWPGPTALLQGALTAAVLAFGFIVPALLRLRQAPTLRVIRRESTPITGASFSAYLLGLALLVLLIAWRSQDVKLASYALLGFAAAAISSLLIGWLTLRAATFLGRRASGVWRQGLLALQRHTGRSISMIVSIGMALMTILLMTLVRGDLLQAWSDKLGAGAPNQFLVNVQPDQVEPVAEFFRAQSWGEIRQYPMVRGRLSAINERAVSAANYQVERAKRMVEREFNLSWSAAPRDDNPLLEGAWWDAQHTGTPELSIEQWIAQELGIKRGDRLTFDVAGVKLSAPVTSVRKVDWDSFRINFYVIASPGFLEGQPTSYVSSFFVPGRERARLDQLVQRFPNLTLVDVTDIVAQIRLMTAQVTRAVQFVFLFTLLAGALVLYTALLASVSERRYEVAVARTLGASSRQVVAAQLLEFAVIGIAAGVLAALGALGVGWWIGREILDVPVNLNAWVPLIGMLGGVLCVCAVGVWVVRAVLRTPPVASLRAA